MRENDNQTATTLYGKVLNCLPDALKAWSVQGSNLRPPVNVGGHHSGERAPFPAAVPLKSPALPRTTRERPAQKSNETAIPFSIPDPFADEKIWEVYGWVL